MRYPSTSPTRWKLPSPLPPLSSSWLNLLKSRHITVQSRYGYEMTSEFSTTAWVRPRPSRRGIVRDFYAALALGVVAVVTATLYWRQGLYEDPAPTWLTALCIAGFTLPLTFRRRYPIWTMVVVSAVFVVTGTFEVPEILISNVGLFLAVYSVGAWSQNRRTALWARLLLAVGMITWLCVSVVVQSANPPEALEKVPGSALFTAYAAFAVLQIIINLLYFGAAIWFGESAWRSAKTRAVLESQGQELERERAMSAQQAIALDRIRIARELHDVVAHHISVVGIQAAAARLSLPEAPPKAREALSAVEDNAGLAIDELRSLVHSLREPGTSDAPSTLGLAQLPGLVQVARDAGTHAELIIIGESRPLPAVTENTLYRVTQEALTNTRKHAGAQARAEVRVRFLGDAVEVEVIDDGLQTSRKNSARVDLGRPGGGLGIQGMRERVGAVGGSLVVTRREERGFLVRAHIPTRAAGLPVSHSGDSL